MTIKQSIPTNTNSNKSLTIGNFKGIDSSSSPFEVNISRATYCENLINENGVNHKRQGWKEIFNSSSELFAVFEIHNKSMLAVITGGYVQSPTASNWRFYTVRTYNKSNMSVSLHDIMVDGDAEDKIDKKYFRCFEKDGIAYLLFSCGNYLYIRSDGKINNVVNSSIAYVPKTTISITRDSEELITRSNYEEANQLCYKRKNSLLGVSNNENIEYESSSQTMDANKTWTLDSAINPSYPIKITIRSLLKDITNLNSSETISSVDFSTASSESSTQKNKVEYAVKNFEINTFTYTQTSPSADSVLYNNGKPIAKINYSTGQIEFYVRTDPMIEGEDNIEVEFVPNPIHTNFSSVIGSAPYSSKLITTILNEEGTASKLLIARDKTIYFSADNDFTYFPFDNYLTLGYLQNDEDSIVAFSRLDDSITAVHTKGYNGLPCIYYMSPTKVEVDGGYKRGYSITAGTAGETPVNEYTNFNLAGDNLFLSENGVYGLTLNENIKVEERYALERSSFINPLLKKHSDLSKARAIVYKNRYYLAIDDVVYVADARFKVSPKSGDMKDTFNYEWWYWTNMPVKEWIILDGKLSFISTNNSICEFYDGYEDISKNQIKSGDTTKSLDDDYKISYSVGLNDFIKNGVEVSNSSTVLRIVESSDIAGVYGRKIYFNDAYILDDLAENSQYGWLRELESGNYINSFTILENNKEEKYILIDTDIGGVGTIVTSTFSSNPFYIVDVDNSNQTFCISISKNGTKKRVLEYGTTATLTKKENVKSIWKTPILSLGTTTYSKSLLSSTLVCEPNVEGYIQYGCKTNNKLIKSDSELSPIYGFDFNNIDFTNLSFEEGLARSRTIKTRIRNFNFIEFIVKSDNNKDCALNNLTVIYNIGRKNKGVR